MPAVTCNLFAPLTNPNPYSLWKVQAHMFKYKYKFFHLFDGFSNFSNICNPGLVFICILIGSGYHLHLYNPAMLIRFSTIIFSPINWKWKLWSLARQISILSLSEPKEEFSCVLTYWLIKMVPITTDFSSAIGLIWMCFLCVGLAQGIFMTTFGLLGRFFWYIFIWNQPFEVNLEDLKR